MMASRMTNWVRFRHQGKTGFGTLTQSEISVHDGEMFELTSEKQRVIDGHK